MARARALAAAACALCAAPWPLSLLISWLFSNRPSWLLPPPPPPGNSSTPESKRADNVSTNTRRGEQDGLRAEEGLLLCELWLTSRQRFHFLF